jgi:hypothetical protein
MDGHGLDWTGLGRVLDGTWMDHSMAWIGWNLVYTITNNAII